MAKFLIVAALVFTSVCAVLGDAYMGYGGRSESGYGRGFAGDFPTTPSTYLSGYRGRQSAYSGAGIGGNYNYRNSYAQERFGGAYAQPGFQQTGYRQPGFARSDRFGQNNYRQAPLQSGYGTGFSRRPVPYGAF